MFASALVIKLMLDKVCNVYLVLLSVCSFDWRFHFLYIIYISLFLLHSLCVVKSKLCCELFFCIKGDSMKSVETLVV